MVAALFEYKLMALDEGAFAAYNSNKPQQKKAKTKQNIDCHYVVAYIWDISFFGHGLEPLFNLTTNQLSDLAIMQDRLIGMVNDFTNYIFQTASKGSCDIAKILQIKIMLILQDP